MLKKKKFFFFHKKENNLNRKIGRISNKIRK